MRGSLAIAVVYLAVAPSTAPAEEALKLADENARINYSTVYRVGNEFRRGGMDLDQALVIKGIDDAFSGAHPALTPTEMREALAGLYGKLRQEFLVESQRRAQVQVEAQRKAGEAFLTANRVKDGVKVTASGLQYKVIEPGSGSSPSPQDRVKVHYRGTRIDGVEFDSSYERGEPAEFRIERAIKGWAEGLQLMNEGAKYELYIPPALAYGYRDAVPSEPSLGHPGTNRPKPRDGGRGYYPRVRGALRGRDPLPNQTLVFEVELLSVVKPAE